MVPAKEMRGGPEKCYHLSPLTKTQNHQGYMELTSITSCAISQSTGSHTSVDGPQWHLEHSGLMLVLKIALHIQPS